MVSVLLGRAPSPSPVTPRAHLSLTTCGFFSGSSSLWVPASASQFSWSWPQHGRKGSVRGALELGPPVLVNGRHVAMEQSPDGLAPLRLYLSRFPAHLLGTCWFCFSGPTAQVVFLGPFYWLHVLWTQKEVFAFLCGQDSPVISPSLVALLSMMIPGRISCSVCWAPSNCLLLSHHGWQLPGPWTHSQVRIASLCSQVHSCDWVSLAISNVLSVKMILIKEMSQSIKKKFPLLPR